MNRELRFLLDGVRQWRVWMFWGWLDVVRAHRRSSLGPLWITLSLLLNIATVGVIFSFLWKKELSEYIPYFTSGMIVWALFNGALEASFLIYVNRALSYLRSARISPSLYILSGGVEAIIVFTYNLLAYILIAFIFPPQIGAVLLLIFPALLFYLINMYWSSLLLGLICLRYRDMVPILKSLMRIAFFLTPVFWQKEMLDRWQFLVDFNPFYHFIAILREPLLGHAPPMMSWWVVLGVTAVGLTISLLAHRKLAHRLPFWC